MADVESTYIQFRYNLIDMAQKNETRILNFTDGTIRNLPAAPTIKRDEYWDDGPRSVKGLVVRVSKSGWKAFELRYRSAGRAQHRYTLGAFPVMTVGEARAEAKRQKLIVDTGGEPTMDRAVKRDELLLSEVIEMYRQWTDGKSDAAMTRDGYCVKMLEQYAPELLRTPLSMVRRDDIERMHRRIGREHGDERGRPYSANAVVRFLRAVFNLARLKSVYSGEQNPARTDSSKRRTGGITTFPEPPRTRYLSDDEIDRVRVRSRRSRKNGAPTSRCCCCSVFAGVSC